MSGLLGVVDAEAGLTQSVQLSLLDRAEFRELAFELLEVANLTPAVVIIERGLKILGHLDESLVALDGVDLTIKLPHLCLEGRVLAFESIADFHEPGLLLGEHADLLHVGRGAILIVEADRVDALRFGVGLGHVEADALESHEDGLDRDRVVRVRLSSHHEGLEFGQVLGGHGDNSGGDLRIATELGQLMLDLGQLTTNGGDSVGVLVGHLHELASQGGGFVQGPVNDHLDVGADLMKAGRDFVRADQQRQATKCQSTDQAPPDNRSCEAHCWFLSADA